MPETFELVHMIIFSVMLVYVMQAGILMYRCDRMQMKLSLWEHHSTYFAEHMDSYSRNF